MLLAREIAKKPGVASAVTHSEGAGARRAPNPRSTAHDANHVQRREFRRRRCPDGLWWWQGPGRRGERG